MNQYKIRKGEEVYSKYVKLRNDKGITDYRVAIDTGIRRSTFSDWKSGRSKPKTDKLKILADYFGVSIDYLACGEKASVISVDGLTDEQVDLVTELARSLQQQNKNHRVTPKSTPTPEQQELVFKVIEQFLK